LLAQTARVSRMAAATSPLGQIFEAGLQHFSGLRLPSPAPVPDLIGDDGDPVGRGFSIQSQLSLGYWIIRFRG
jgi:hypothetical protein